MIQREEIKPSLALPLLHLTWPNKNFDHTWKRKSISKPQNDPN
jgi:hypothetical protein